MKKVNLLKLTAAVLSLGIMFYALSSYIVPSRAAAEESTSEIRAVWVASVFSLDYPSRVTSSEKELSKRIDEIMDNCQSAGFNTVFFQVRPACDALYKSEIFPWSKYLTGKQGKAPENDFDPLEYAVSAAHKRNMTLHAWINPYRVTVSAGDEDGLSSGSIAKTNPEYTVKCDDGKIYLNPALSEVRALVTRGAVEILQNYDVDGIHLDDYFYPSGEFDDSEEYSKYGGGKSLEDWRRDNVTALIKELSSAVHKENKNAMLSVSPSGIWANRESLSEGSATDGYESYFKSYADTRLWVEEELIDCIIPQIYWNRGYEAADFSVLLKWWSDLTKDKRVKLCIALAAYKASDSNDTASVWYGESGVEELRAQIDLCRIMNCDGYGMYRYGSVASNKNIFDMTAQMNKTEEPSEIFTDINDFPWAKEAISALYDKKIINGMGDGSFGGKNTVSRADFTVMLYRALGKTASFEENFADVKKTDYFYNEIGMARALGIANGMGENLFLPRENISRQDMAVMLYRVLKSEGKISEKVFDEALFSDGEEVKAYAKEAIASLCAAGIINGYDDKTFKPSESATRAETAVLINKTLNLLK